METTTFQKPVINLTATGDRIKTLMENAGYSASYIQKHMGFPYIQTVYNWTRGVNLPTIDNLVVLSELFGIPINDILVTDTVEIQLENGDGETRMPAPENAERERT